MRRSILVRYGVIWLCEHGRQWCPCMASGYKFSPYQFNEYGWATSILPAALRAQ
jgi:hypothetical protein